MKKIILLRIIHGIFAIYFIFCLVYLYYSVLFFNVNIFLIIAIVSLGIEGFIVFVLNKGDCPLIYVQRKVKDETPFFELFLPAKTAKKAIPFFAILTWVALGLLTLRFLFLVF